MSRFLGLEPPFEAAQALRILPKLEAIQPVLDEVLACILGQPATAEQARTLGRATSLDGPALGALFTGLDWMLRTCIRSSLKAKALHEELTESRVHPPFIEPILGAVKLGCTPPYPRVAGAARAQAHPIHSDHAVGACNRRVRVPALRRRARLAPTQLADLEDEAELRSRLDLPSLDELRWRLDVIISSSSVQVVLRPQLTLQCTLSDGTVHAFHVRSRERTPATAADACGVAASSAHALAPRAVSQVSKQMLNELRYTAARCLKEMDDLETRLPALP